MISMDKRVKLQKIFREVLDDPALSITDDFSPDDDAAWDSVAMVKIILTVEAEFDKRFSTQDIPSIKSVGDIIKLLH